MLVFVFFIAGCKSFPSTLAYTQNQKLMNRANEEVQQILDKFDGKLTYESIMEMKFIDLCVKETFRKYPRLPIFYRERMKDYHIPRSKIMVSKGTLVIVSLLGIHPVNTFS